MFASDFMNQIQELEDAQARLRAAQNDVAGREYNLARDVAEQVYRGNLTPGVLKVNLTRLKREVR